MATLLNDPVRHLVSLLDTAMPRYIIGMAGVPGSGKSTLAAKLAAEVNACTAPNTMIALGMDGFHLTKAQLRQLPDPAEALRRRGAPWTFDPEALLKRLQALRHGAGRNAIDWPDFQHEIGDPVEGVCTVPPITRLLLVEGIYLLNHSDGWQAVSETFDERWYLDTPIDIAMERLALRHMEAWNMTHDEAAERINTNDRINADIVLSSREFADCWIVA